MKKNSFFLALTLIWLACLGPAAVGAQTLLTQRYSASINGAKISYTMTGGGAQTILLIHGYPLNSDLFVKQRDALGANYRVITVDLRGFGRSVAPDTNGSVNLYVSDMFGLLDQLGIQNLIVGGHSLGGAVALRMYQTQPTRIQAILLNDPAAMAPGIAEQAMWQGYADESAMYGSDPLVPMLLANFLTGFTRVTNPALVTDVSNLILAASDNGLVGGALALKTRPDFTALFPAISVPVLLLYGEDDPLTPIEQGALLGAVIPQSTFDVIPKASHAVIREKAQEANAAILAWLATLPTASTN